MNSLNYSYDIAWGIEYHKPAAEIYHANFQQNPYQDLLIADPWDY